MNAKAFHNTSRTDGAQVRRLQLTARCLDLQPVFTNDGDNLVAELFDSRGGLVEQWSWARQEILR